MESYSVKRAAELIGVDAQTLFRWIWGGKVRASIVIPMDSGSKVHRFTEQDVKRLRLYKAEHYWEGRGGSKPKRKEPKESK
jgi:predicted site-specific integrase-resolvase